MRKPIEEVLPGPAKDSEELRVVVIALGGERLAVQQHVLLRTTKVCELKRNTIMVKADTILGCQIVAEFKGNVHDFGQGYDRLLPHVWQYIQTCLNYRKPTEDMVKLWSELQTQVVTLFENDEREGPVGKVKLAGKSCRCDKLYDIKVAPGAVMHKFN